MGNGVTELDPPTGPFNAEPMKVAVVGLLDELAAVARRHQALISFSVSPIEDKS